MAELSGGGINVSQGTTVVVRNSTISGNLSTNSTGGALRITSGVDLGATSVTLENSTISGNSAAGNGGGISTFTPLEVISLTLKNCTIAFNTADSRNTGFGTGGGIHMTSPRQ
jgi:hypothetical protein